MSSRRVTAAEVQMPSFFQNHRGSARLLIRKVKLELELQLPVMTMDKPYISLDSEDVEISKKLTILIPVYGPAFTAGP